MENVFGINFKEKYMSILDIARLLHFSNTGIRRIVRRNNIKKVWDDKTIKNHGRWLIDTDELMKYFKQFN